MVNNETLNESESFQALLKQCSPFDPKMLEDIRELVGDVEVDLDKPLDEDDE